MSEIDQALEAIVENPDKGNKMQLAQQKDSGAAIDPAAPMAAILPSRASTAWLATNRPLSASNSWTLSNSTGARAAGVRKRSAIAFTSAAVAASCAARSCLIAPS